MLITVFVFLLDQLVKNAEATVANPESDIVQEMEESHIGVNNGSCCLLTHLLCYQNDAPLTNYSNLMPTCPNGNQVAILQQSYSRIESY